MASTRPRSHTQRLVVIAALKAHVEGAEGDPAVREAHDRHLAESLPAWQSAHAAHKPLDGRWREVRQKERAESLLVARTFRIAASGIRGPDGKEQPHRVRELADGRNVAEVLRLSGAARVRAIGAFLDRVGALTDLHVHPGALAELKDAHARLTLRVAELRAAYQVRIAAGAALDRASERFDRDYGRFLREVAWEADPSAVKSVTVAFAPPPKRKKPAADKAGKVKESREAAAEADGRTAPNGESVKKGQGVAPASDKPPGEATSTARAPSTGGTSPQSESNGKAADVAPAQR